VESAVQKNLDTLRKNLTTEQISQSIDRTHKAGIKTYLTYIFGIPGETYEDGLQTIDFSIRKNSFYAEFFPITPWPGTDLWKDEAYGHRIRDLSKMTMLQDKVAFVPHSMSEEELEGLLGLAYKRFYLRLRFVLGRIRSIRSGYDLKIIFFGGLALISMLFRRKEKHPDRRNRG